MCVATVTRIFDPMNVLLLSQIHDLVPFFFHEVLQIVHVPSYTETKFSPQACSDDIDSTLFILHGKKMQIQPLFIIPLNSKVKISCQYYYYTCISISRLWHNKSSLNFILLF